MKLEEDEIHNVCEYASVVKGYEKGSEKKPYSQA